jgi:hypothetical protein
MAKEFSSKMETKIREATKKYGLVKSIEVQEMGDDLVLVGYDKNDEVVRVKVGTVKEEYDNGINDKESRRELGNKKYGSGIKNSLIGRWESKGGKYWIELNKDDMGYSYNTNNGGGNIGNVPESSAIKDIDEMIKDSIQYDGINMRRVK